MLFWRGIFSRRGWKALPRKIYATSFAENLVDAGTSRDQAVRLVGHDEDIRDRVKATCIWRRATGENPES